MCTYFEQGLTSPYLAHRRPCLVQRACPWWGARALAFAALCAVQEHRMRAGCLQSWHGGMLPPKHGMQAGCKRGATCRVVQHAEWYRAWPPRALFGFLRFGVAERGCASVG
eukprot:365277-Chlamydomonas_euryale.AAC.26